MHRKNLPPCLLALALALAAPGASAQAAASATPTVDPATIQALKDMGAYLHDAEALRVSTELTGERVLADGQKLQHMASAATGRAAAEQDARGDVQPALGARAVLRRQDGRRCTRPAQKYYSTVEFTGTLGELVDALQAKYGVELPLSDLFVWGTPAAPLDKIESAMNAGQDFVGDDLCDHYAFRQGKIDWQIWIAAGGKPLPRKLVITNRADEARPQSVSLIDWNLKPDVHGLDVHVHAAERREEDRDRAAQGASRGARR